MATTPPKPRARKAAPKRVARPARAARAEAQPQPRTITYHGLTITVPPVTEWSSDLYFIVAELEEGETPGLVLKALSGIIGSDQVALVRAQLAADGVKMGETRSEIIELFNTVFAEYGTSVGESKASSSS